MMTKQAINNIFKRSNILFNSSCRKEQLNNSNSYTIKEYLESNLKDHKKYTDTMIKAGFAFVGLGVAGLESAIIVKKNEVDEKITKLENKVDEKITKLENKVDEISKEINQTNNLIVKFLYETNPKKAKEVLYSK